MLFLAVFLAVLFLALPELLERALDAPEPERDAGELAEDRGVALPADREPDPPLDRELELPEPPALLARVALARLARVFVVPASRVARVFAARLAESLRWSALRLRVRAAFFAASSRFWGPPVARSSSVSARPRRSLAVFRKALGALPPVSFAIVAASATVRATLLRTPPARTAL